MYRRLAFIPILLLLSCFLFADDYVTKGEHIVAVNFSGGPSYYIGFSSTRVDNRNHTATAIDDDRVSFALNSSGDRVASFYIYWKLYVADQVTVTLSDLTPLTNTPADGEDVITISYASIFDVNGNTIESVGRVSSNGTNTTTSYVIYEDDSSGNTSPRIGSRQVTFKLDLDDDTMSAIGSATSQYFDAATIQINITTKS